MTPALLRWFETQCMSRNRSNWGGTKYQVATISNISKLAPPQNKVFIFKQMIEGTCCGLLYYFYSLYVTTFRTCFLLRKTYFYLEEGGMQSRHAPREMTPGASWYAESPPSPTKMSPCLLIRLLISACCS